MTREGRRSKRSNKKLETKKKAKRKMGWTHTHTCVHAQQRPPPSQTREEAVYYVGYCARNSVRARPPFFPPPPRRLCFLLLQRGVSSPVRIPPLPTHKLAHPSLSPRCTEASTTPQGLNHGLRPEAGRHAWQVEEEEVEEAEAPSSSDEAEVEVGTRRQLFVQSGRSAESSAEALSLKQQRKMKIK